MSRYAFTVNKNGGGLRLDQAIAHYLPEFSRSAARKLIQIGAVWLNDKRAQVLSRTVLFADSVTIYIGRTGWEQFYEIDPDNILYRDPWLFFYRKEPGIPTQGIISDNYNNVHAGLVRHLRQKTDAPYVGIHHRLDIETSGVVLFTTSQKANRGIHEQFKVREVKKVYLALVEGVPDFSTRTLTTSISKLEGKYYCSAQGPGKSATTIFTKLSDYKQYCLIKAEPLTGRTHQIRLQLAFVGHPILGDRLYGGKALKDIPRTMLHAESLTVRHPFTKKEMTITAAVFDDMQKLINNKC